MNVIDILILVVIAACLVLAFRSRKKARVKGGGCCSACSGSCPGCGSMKENK